MRGGDDFRWADFLSPSTARSRGAAGKRSKIERKSFCLFYIKMGLEAALGAAWQNSRQYKHLLYFLIFSIIKNDCFCIFNQVNLTGAGVGFFNKTGAEIASRE